MTRPTLDKPGGPVSSPYVNDSGIDANGRHITVTWAFNNATRNLQSCTVHRDAGCLYTKILVGIGADGTPDSTTHSFNVGNVNNPPDPDKVFNAAQMSAVGLDTIEDVLGLQITFGF